MSARSPYCLAFALSLFTLSDAQADSMRCNDKLVASGDTLYEVESRCGSPADKQHRTETRTVRSWINLPCAVPGQANCGQMIERTVEVTVDEWLYDFGPDRFIEHLFFEQGRLVRVVSGHYGNKKD